MSVDLRRFGPENVDGVRGLLAGLYTAVYAGDPVGDPAAFAQRLARQSVLPGWVCAIGYNGGQAIGYAYGHPLPAGTDWWCRTAPHRADEDEREDGTFTFTLAEIGVLPPWRKTGTARRLHDHLLVDRPEQSSPPAPA